MKKIFNIFLTFFIFIFILTGCGNNTSVDESATNYEASRTIRIKEEIELSSFSTPLKSGSPNRIKNIQITCSKLDGLVIPNGETFSFNAIVGPCTAEEGYLKSEIYVNKKITYALGGGNCQVSTTLYNCCLQIDGVSIVERHEHGLDVDYIEDGKDACVSYNTKDFAFKNETGSDLKIYTSIDSSNVYAKICTFQ